MPLRNSRNNPRTRTVMRLSAIQGRGHASDALNTTNRGNLRIISPCTVANAHGVTQGVSLDRVSPREAFNKALCDMKKFRWVRMPYESWMGIRLKDWFDEKIPFMLSRQHLDAMKGRSGLGNCVDAALCFSLFASVYSQDLSEEEANGILKAIKDYSLGTYQENLLALHKKSELDIRHTPAKLKILSRMLQDGDIICIRGHNCWEPNRPGFNLHWVVYSDGSVLDAPLNSREDNENINMAYGKIPLADFLEQTREKLKPGGGLYNQNYPGLGKETIVIYRNPFLSGNKEATLEALNNWVKDES